jgi:hypothetical protein
MENFKLAEKMFSKSFQTYTDLRKQITESLPTPIIEILTDNGEVLSSLPIHKIMKAVHDEFTELNESRRSHILTELNKHLGTIAGLASHIHLHRKYNEILRNNNQLGSTYTAFVNFVKTIDMHEALAEVVEQYKRENPSTLKQNVSELMNYIKTQKTLNHFG